MGMLVILLLFNISVVQASDHPDFYIDKDACPFECCTYREWHTKKTTKLYSEPTITSSHVGIAENGTEVKAQTGEVHIKPGKFIVKNDITTFKKGDILWVYTYLGEGFFKIWHQDNFIEEQIVTDYKNPTIANWGYFERIPESSWWVKIRTPAKIVGWTNQPENFSNKDACG